MNLHEQFADDLSLYALAALDADQQLAIERHLQECADCRRELERLRGDLALLALSVTGAQPPARSRERLMSAIAKERRRIQPRSRKSNTWWKALEVAAAIAAVAIIIFFVRQNRNLQQRVADLETRSAAQQQDLLKARELLATLTSADAERFTLVTANTRPQPQGKAIYVPRSGTLVFLASNMPAIPSQKTYELWLIPKSGAPIPAGLFRPDARGSASLIKPPLPPGVEAKTFAISVEPESGSPAPSSQPIMVGIGE